MRKMRFASAVVVVVGLGVVGCAEPNSLSGSIDSSHDLTFDAVGLRLFTDQKAYELKYTKLLDSGDTDVVAKVVFDVPSESVPLGTAIDLLDTNGKVERITAANDPFPDLESGSITFAAGGSDEGSTTTGEFASTFTNGRTLNGTFETELEFASFE
jgi:hypothetical protein